MAMIQKKGGEPSGGRLRRIPVLSVIGLVLTLTLIGSAGAVFAYFQQVGKTENQLKTPPFDVRIEEEFIPREWDGDPIAKRVTLHNSGKAPAIVRVSYAEMWWDEHGNSLSTLNIVDKNWAGNWGDPAYWTDGGDGWYYYNRIVHPDGAVEILNSVALSTSLTTEQKAVYTRGKYQLDFISGSVQADAAAVLEVWGVECSLSGDTVVWSFS